MRFFVSLAGLACLVAPAVAGDVDLSLDQARLYSLERPVGSIVVANPSIADVAVHSSTELVLFGKMPGLTNLFVFDAEGRPMGSVSLRVSNPRSNMVTVYAGSNRMTMSCASVCEPTYTVGDGVNGLRPQGTDVAAQASLRFGMASDAADGSASSRQTAAPSISGGGADNPDS